MCFTPAFWVPLGAPGEPSAGRLGSGPCRPEGCLFKSVYTQNKFMSSNFVLCSNFKKMPSNWLSLSLSLSIKLLNRVGVSCRHRDISPRNTWAANIQAGFSDIVRPRRCNWHGPLGPAPTFSADPGHLESHTEIPSPSLASCPVNRHPTFPLFKPAKPEERLALLWGGQRVAAGAAAPARWVQGPPSCGSQPGAHSRRTHGPALLSVTAPTSQLRLDRARAPPTSSGLVSPAWRCRGEPHPRPPTWPHPGWGKGLSWVPCNFWVGPVRSAQPPTGSMGRQRAKETYVCS